MSEIGWSGVCKHGWYCKDCNQCKMEAEIERLQSADFRKHAVEAVRDAESKRNEYKNAARACYAALGRPGSWAEGERARLLMRWPWLEER